MEIINTQVDHTGRRWLLVSAYTREELERYCSDNRYKIIKRLDGPDVLRARYSLRSIPMSNGRSEE
jgi:hypothetical protein